MIEMKIRIGCEPSDLALRTAELAAKKLEAHGVKALQVRGIESNGVRRADIWPQWHESTRWRHER